MKEALQLAAAGAGAALLLIVLRQTSPDIAGLLCAAAGVMLMLLVAEKIGGMAEMLSSLAARTGMQESAGLMFRITGVGLLCEAGGRLCRDAGEESIGEKVEMGGRMLMLSLAVPAALSLLDAVFSLLSW